MIHTRRPQRRAPGATAPLLLLTLAAGGLAGCDSDDDSGIDTGAGGISREDVSSYYTASDTLGSSTLYRSDDRFGDRTSFRGGYGSGAAMGYDGTVYLSGVGTSGPAIRAVDRARERGDGEAFDPARDREISGPATTLVEPTDLTLSRREGLLFVADRGMNAVTVFGEGVSGNVPPLAVTRLGARPIATAYAEEDDRLFVARDGGAIDVYDDYAGSGFRGNEAVAMPTRSFRVQRRATTPGVYASIGAIEYVDGIDELLISDIGAPGTETDGAILRVGAASSTTGDALPATRLGGPFSRLRDPQGFEYRQGRLRVADPSSGRIYQYVLGDAEIGDIDRAPFAETEAINPRTVLSEPLDPTFEAMPSDLDDPARPPVGLASLGAPGVDGSGEPLASNNMVSRFDLATGGVSMFDANLEPGTDMRSLAYDGVGDGYLGYENVTTGRAGVMVASRLAAGRRRPGVDDRYTPSRDRLIEGPSTGITSPRGIDLDDASGMLMVADGTSRTVRVFRRGAAGDQAPLFTTSVPAGPSSLDYDGTNDRLFVGGDDGQVNVYDDFLGSRPTQPSRRFGFDDGLTTGVQESANLRGLSYDQTNDRILLSDYAAGAPAGNGRVYGYAGASTASGILSPSVRLNSTTATTLSTPSSVALGGSTAYVSDFTTNSVYVYDDVFSSGLADPNERFDADRGGALSFQASAQTPIVGGSYR